MTPAPQATHALKHSAAVADLLRQEIATNQGWIGFDRFMECALYAPEIGYYSAAREPEAIFGARGDFLTAPEITPLFAATLARALIPLLQESAPHLIEFGAGSGQLAHDLLPHLQAALPQLRYTIIEISPALRARQQQRLAVHEIVDWQTEVPEDFCGVVLGNEVLDALPVKRLCFEEGRWQEQGVIWAHDCFAWALRPTDLRLPIPAPSAGYCSEWHSAAQALVHSVLGRIKKGALLFIDYGYEQEEYYHPERAQGSLTCFYQHQHHSDPLYQPGAQDLTAHLDFTALMQAATQAGGELLYFGSQARFLLALGLLEGIPTTPDQILPYLRETQAIQKLVSPTEMGELFKVWIVGKGGMIGAHLP